MNVRTRPYRYVPLASLWCLLIGIVVRRAPQRVDELNGRELTQLALSTYALTTVLAKEKAGSFFREPFVEPKTGAPSDAVRGDQQQPVDHKVLGTIGELVTCTRCLGMWVAAMLTFMRMLAPRESRILMPLLSAVGANNLLQVAHTVAANAANTLEGPTEPAGSEDRDGTPSVVDEDAEAPQVNAVSPQVNGTRRNGQRTARRSS